MTNEFHFTALVELCRKTSEEIRQTPSAKSAALSLSSLETNLAIRPTMSDELRPSLFEPLACRVRDIVQRYVAQFSRHSNITLSEKHHPMAEYSPTGYTKPVGPEDLKSSLPSVEEIESELGGKR